MAIKLYKGSVTAGGTDGTEITAAEPLIMDGMYPASGNTAFKWVKVAIRTDDASTKHNIGIQIKGPSASTSSVKWWFSATNSAPTTVPGNYASAALYLYEISGVNTIFYVGCTAVGGDAGSPDTTIDLVVTEGL